MNNVIFDAFIRFKYYRDKYNGTYLYPNYERDLDMILGYMERRLDEYNTVGVPNNKVE